MKTVYSKVISIIASSAIFFSAISNNINIPIPKSTDAALSYRTKFTLYGDLDGDEEINSFDMVIMRQAITDGEYILQADLNSDKIVDNEDLKILRNYVLADDSIIEAYLYDDADGDGLCDMLEVTLLKSDPDSCDTDKDGLSDYEEIIFTRTSPTNRYSRSDQITDDLDDPDEDKLTNKDEVSNNTNPLLNDSDCDNISDYDEINIYKTNPNSEDTDNDGITDGDEILLGLSPDKDKSDGMLSDNCRTFEHQIPSSDDILSGINTEDNPYEISIDISSAGNYGKALSIKSLQLTDDSTEDGIIGEAVELTYTDGLSVDNAKIYFNPKNLDGNIEDYMIFKYFPETNYLLPVETKYTDDSAYVETNELGTFCFVSINNISINDIGGSHGVKSIDVIYDYELGEVEAAFIVDVSGCLVKNLDETKQSIHDCCEALFKHSNNANVSIIGHYVSSDQSKICFANITNSDNDPILNNIESVDQALSKLKNVTTNEDSILNGSILFLDQLKDELYTNAAHKYAFIMCDSVYSFSDRMQYKLTVPQMVRESLSSLNDSGIKLKFLLSTDCFKYKEAIKNFKEACAKYDFEVLSKAGTGYFGDTEFSSIYSDAVIKKETESIVFTCSSNPSVIPSYVNRNAFINSLPNSFDTSRIPPANDDGEIDFIEASLATGAAHYDKDGKIVFTNYKDACYANDLTRIGYDQLILKYGIELRLICGDIDIAPFDDKILYMDTDGDGLKDKDDPYPHEPFDERFEIVDDYNSTFPESDFVNKRWQESEECYGSVSANVGDIIAAKFIKASLTELAGLAYYLPLSGIWSALQGSDNKLTWSQLPNAAEMLWEYLNNDTNRLILHPSDVKEIISCHDNNILHLKYNINQLLKVAEQTTYNNSAVICTMPDSNMRSVCMVDRLGECELRGIDINGVKHPHTMQKITTGKQADWNLSVGSCYGGMVADITSDGNNYSMKYRYYILDIYEWAAHVAEPETLSQMIHRLHELGEAHQFLIAGYYEGTLHWKKGESTANDYIMQQIYYDLNI
ncbi:MAG: hypothetical protein GX567_04390 [Clostridia bacterium]|nr:hypothetical protein [Clostridia bacterium]